jgi:SAM-dependent methyltransferase
MNALMHLSPTLGTDMLQLACPQCQTVLGCISTAMEQHSGYVCPNCEMHLQQRGGIWEATVPARARYFEKFLREYSTVREAEGRGSNSSDYYLALPYRDVTGHNQSQWRIRGRSFRTFERDVLPFIERKGEALRVLDLGAGNGWLSYRLALRGHSPVAVDLLTNNRDGLGAASHYREKLRTLFPRFRAEHDRLPFGDDQFECAIFNASFHYSENAADTLKEAVRCVRDGGLVVIIDTPWYSEEKSGLQMIKERKSAFKKRFGFASDALRSVEFLTDERLDSLGRECGIAWRVIRPWYGFAWAFRPYIAAIQGKREPSRFRIYAAQVNKA